MDLSSSIIPKSDQLNSDDFIATGPITIKITDVKANADAMQPVSIFFEGDNNKPYKPGLSMRRVLLSVWGKESKAYIGRSLTLYREDNVAMGGVKVGGIRISNMSDISSARTIVLTVSRGKKTPFTIQPLVVAATPTANTYGTKEKEEITPKHPKWENALSAIKTGATDLAKIKAVYIVSEENEKLLSAK